MKSFILGLFRIHPTGTIAASGNKPDVRWEVEVNRRGQFTLCGYLGEELKYRRETSVTASQALSMKPGMTIDPPHCIFYRLSDRETELLRFVVSWGEEGFVVKFKRSDLVSLLEKSTI